jgi:deoxycytidine triphosphate deaminase
MARILPDREIRALIGSVFIGADERYINPNGIELRLGEHIRFDSTGEQKRLGPGLYLKVNPGENVIISSLEKLDFTAATVHKIYPDKMLMGLITPTTTMMREGISQVATKVDAGFRGLLNWGFRNSSTKEFILQYGEPIFKITIFLLERDESPDIAYGEGERHTYQDTKGIKLSTRRIPAQISKESVIASSFDKLDPKKQLREAGYPFDHIGTELAELQGKWEVVSTDVRLIKEDFKKQTDALSKKITEETKSISDRLDDFRQTFFERVEALFEKKFFWVVGALVAAFAFIISACNYLRDKKVDTLFILIIGLGAGIVILIITYLIARRLK